MPHPVTILLAALIVMLVAGAFATIAMADDSADLRPRVEAAQNG
jgi:hypothetical protein